MSIFRPSHRQLLANDPALTQLDLQLKANDSALILLDLLIAGTLKLTNGELPAGYRFATRRVLLPIKEKAQ